MTVVDYTIIKARSLNELEEAVCTKINESVQKEISAVRDELGLTQYKFPWEV